jgi:hypothetical protein
MRKQGNDVYQLLYLVFDAKIIMFCFCMLVKKNVNVIVELVNEFTIKL